MQVRNQILMLGNAVAAEVDKRRETHRRWLLLGPVPSGVELREVEVPADADPEDWPTPETDPVTVFREVFKDLDAAIAALIERGYDVDAFDALWKSPNPF